MDDLKLIFKNNLGIAAKYNKQITAAMICKTFDNSLKEVFGEDVVKDAWAISFKEGALKVGVKNSVLSQEIQGHWGKLVSEESQIKRLVFEIV